MSRRTVAGAVVAMLVLAACGGPRLGPGEARLTVSAGGRTLVADEGRPLRPVDGSRTLRRGARVKVLAGFATMGLAGGSEIGLRGGSEVNLAARPTLVTGDLLAVARRPLTLEAGSSTIVVEGAARLSRDLAVSAASYHGNVSLESAGRSLRVAPLRQAAVPSLGVVPAEPQPLRYRLTDPWDRRFLGPAMDLGEELQARSRGLTVSLPPGEGRTPGFYRLLVPDLEREPAFDAPLLSDARPAGETLVGAVITVSGRRGTFLDRWGSVFSFRQQGASWGLVALEQGISDAPALVRSLDLAIGRAPLAFAAPPPAAGTPPPGPGPGTGGGPAAGRPRAPAAPRGAASGPGSSPGQGASSGRPPLPRPPPSGTPLDPVVKPLVDTVDGLLPRP